MFITSQGFKKLINEAYKKGCLHIANDGEGITISGEYWEIWIMHGWIPKKELAAIIELTGAMPAKGEAFEASKDGNQYEANFNDRKTTMEAALNCEYEIEITPLVLRYQTGQQAVHNNREIRELLCEIAQIEYEVDHTHEEWMRIAGKNYL